MFGTVNVQHLESLNDQVAQLTGTRVRETIPDSVLAQADEVVLVDITPEALIARLKAGKVDPAERVPAALGNFFKIENLAALRETALRQVAEGVEARRLVSPTLPVRRDDRLVDPAEAPAIGERLLAIVSPTPESQRVLRRAWRSAQRLGAELDVLVVRGQGHEPAPQEREQLEALRRLAAVLGAHVLIEDGDDVAETAIRVARERGTTYVLLGAPPRATRPRAAARVAADTPRTRPARRGRAHRRRPHAARPRHQRSARERSRAAGRAAAVTAALVAVCAVVAALAGAGATLATERVRRRRALSAADPVRLIAFPFTGETLSEPVLSAALRIARVEHATLMPVYLVLVPLAFALDVPAPTQCDAAFSMLEIVERRAARAEVAVDSRVELGAACATPSPG